MANGMYSVAPLLIGVHVTTGDFTLTRVGKVG